MKERITSHTIRAATSLIIVAAAAWIFRGVLLEFLVEPIGWLLWAAWRLVASVDRSLIWMILMIVCSLLIIRIVPPDAVGGGEDRDEIRQSWNTGNRLAHWRTWAARSMTDVAGRSAFRLSLESLAAAVAEATRIPLPASLHAPPEAQENEPGEQAGIARLGPWLARKFPDHRRRRDARRIDDLLTWMEAALEIRHGQ